MRGYSKDTTASTIISSYLARFITPHSCLVKVDLHGLVSDDDGDKMVVITGPSLPGTVSAALSLGVRPTAAPVLLATAGPRLLSRPSVHLATPPCRGRLSAHHRPLQLTLQPREQVNISPFTPLTSYRYRTISLNLQTSCQVSSPPEINQCQSTGR